MKIPEDLMPKRAAELLGVSIGQLAVDLGCSYHLLHGWQRRGTAPAHSVKWMAGAVADLAERKRREVEAIKDPVDRAVAISQIPILAVQGLGVAVVPK